LYGAKREEKVSNSKRCVELPKQKKLGLIFLFYFLPPLSSMNYVRIKLPKAFNAMIAAPVKLYNFRTPMFPVHDRTKCYGAGCVLCDAELVIAIPQKKIGDCWFEL
jgi:hypothetical protein